jgi:hypothetical protein
MGWLIFLIVAAVIFYFIYPPLGMLLGLIVALWVLAVLTNGFW